VSETELEMMRVAMVSSLLLVADSGGGYRMESLLYALRIKTTWI
jgi:hypothetical protein